MKKHVPIPDDWSVEQLSCVINFLDNIIDSIWCMYADELNDMYSPDKIIVESLEADDLFEEDTYF